MKDRGVAVPSPSPTAQDTSKYPTPTTVQTDVGDNDTNLIAYGIGSALILSAVAAGATIFTIRRRRRLTIDEDDNPWVTNTPLSPPTMKVVRAMDGTLNAREVE